MNATLPYAHELIQQGRFDEAVVALEEIVSNSPQSSEARYALGYVYFQKKRWTDASMEFEESLALDHGNANSAFYLGEIALQGGHTATAQEYFQQSLEINPQHQSASERLASLGVRGISSRQATYATVPSSSPLKMEHSEGGAVFETLLSDPSETAQRAVKLIRELDMDKRPRMAPYLFPKFLDFLIAFTALYVAAYVTVIAPRTTSLPLMTAEQRYKTTQPTAAQIESSIRENDEITASQFSPQRQSNNLWAERMEIRALGFGAVLLCCLLLFNAWLVSRRRFTFDEGRLVILTGFIRNRQTIELYRVVGVSVKETLLTKLTGDAYLIIEHKDDNKQQYEHLLGLAKYDRLVEIQDQLRNLVGMLRSIPWIKGIIY